MFSVLTFILAFVPRCLTHVSLRPTCCAMTYVSSNFGKVALCQSLPGEYVAPPPRAAPSRGTGGMSLLAWCGLGEAGWFKRGTVSRARELRARQPERQVSEVALPGETNATLNMFLNYECQLDDDDMSADDHASDMAALGSAVSVPARPMFRACHEYVLHTARGAVRGARAPALAAAPDAL